MKRDCKLQRKTFLALPGFVNRKNDLQLLLSKIKGFGEKNCSRNDWEGYETEEMNVTVVALTLSHIVVHRQLKALSSPHHPDGVPLVVVELLPCIQGLGPFA